MTDITVLAEGIFEVGIDPGATVNVAIAMTPLGTVPPGSSADLNFVFDQPTPAATWLVNHSLGKYPAVSIVDSAGTVVYGNVTYVNLNQVQIDFTAAFSGKAYFN